MSTGGAPPGAARAAASAALLACHCREDPRWRLTPDPGGPAAYRGTLALRGLPARLRAGVRHVSPTGHHRFTGEAWLEVAGEPLRPLAHPVLAGLLMDDLARADRRGPGDPSALMARMIDSADMVDLALRARADELDRLWSADPLPFIESEGALLIGHLLHPTPKSRGEMSPDDRVRYSPEVGARFPLHWLAVDPELVVHDSAAGRPAPGLAEALLRRDRHLDHGALERALSGLGPRILVPVHPWEAGHLADGPELAPLREAGAVVDLGPFGGPVTPTTSLRTVYREDWPWQVKLSLHVRVTNSMRVTLPKELRRAVEAARLDASPLGDAARAAAPHLTVLHDPAYLAVLGADGAVIDGLSVLLRDNRWQGRTGDATAVTTLIQDDPCGGRSRLGRIVARLARDGGTGEQQIAREWFRRYCEVVSASLLRLYLDVGLCFEPHAQNTVLELDGGWPERCVVRDSQGYFHREAAHADVTAVLPGHGEESESIFPEALADERLVYYPFVNNALGVVAALGAAGVIDEDILLGDLRDVIARERARGGRYPATLLDRLLDDPTWPCKANLRTRLHDMDELVGDIADQSVYVRIPNPLRP